MELPLILLPGLLNTARLWDRQARALERRRPVHVADITGADSVAALAETVLAEAPERFALAGMSMGGYVAFAILRRAPERVARLALLDTTAAPDTAEATARRRGQMARAGEGGIGAVLPDLLPAFLGPAHDPALAALVTAMAEEVGVEGFVHQQTAILGRPDSRPELGNIRCPTSVIVGSEDTITPPAVMEELAASIPGARFTIIPGAGHLTPIIAPDAVTAALAAWLDA